MVAVMLPVPVDLTKPMVWGLAKLPVESLSSAVKVLDEENVNPKEWKGIETLLPGQVAVE